MPSPRHPLHPVELIGRSLFPFVALVLLSCTALFGPWVLFGVTWVWWRLVTRLG